jgi:hypothetical protein
MKPKVICAFFSKIINDLWINTTEHNRLKKKYAGYNEECIVADCYVHMRAVTSRM